MNVIKKKILFCACGNDTHCHCGGCHFSFVEYRDTLWPSSFPQLNLHPFLCLQYQGARDPGDEQASSEPEEEEAHLCARGQQTASMAG